MKKVYFLLLTAFLMLSLSVQSQTFEKGDFGLNVGIGIGYRGFPIEVSGTYGIVDNLFNVDGLTMSVGGYVGFSSWNNSILWGKGFAFLPAARVLAHYSFFDNFEVYAGPMAGFRVDSYTIFTSSVSVNFFAGATGGAKYYFTDNFGVYAEVGYGIGNLMAGATFKF